MIDPVEALNSAPIQELHRMSVEEFRPRGRKYDENADMPDENIQQLFEGGWLTTTLSKERGGKGSNLDTDDPATYLQAIRVIARGCSGTAHCCQVQNHVVWAMDLMATDDQRKRYLEPMMEKPFLSSFVGSEAKRRHMYKMNTTATPTDGGFIVRGEKNYATNGPTMAFAIIFAAIAGVEDYLDNHQMILVRPDMKGVSIDLDWYRPAGMRTASSPIITLDDVFIEQKDVFGGPGAFPRSRLQGKFHLGFAANYLGTAEGMFDWYIDYVGGRGKGSDGIIQLRTGEMSIALKAAEALFHDAIRAWKTKSVVEAELLSIAAKSMAAQVAFENSHKIIHAAGSTAMFDEFPLSRYIRDLETHVLHAGHDRSAQILGQAAFGEGFDSTLQR
ncbi:acyl-CoA dehydrogenase family protein [Oceanibacterium hippocampi]|uniref:Dibenzothiophene monooxygenase n=1 Tax=Oceanibacterium hippocampi TaxID=745714 RepID=A0A1Y5TH31_9PROT|nr:acyl-CoA dehydrogenase family protein [Oceanibacterium hippocampi]SLN63735.1 Dibenzothiophene desulfurization enzyme C [Oceanibacterium hippocampi]